MMKGIIAKVSSILAKAEELRRQYEASEAYKWNLVSKD